MAKYLRTFLLSTYILVASATPLTTVIASQSSSAVNCQKDVKAFMQKADKEQAQWANKAALAYWAYESNLTEHNLKEQLRVASESANYSRNTYEEIQKCQWQDLQDEDLKRQLKQMGILGQDALPPEKFEELEKLISKMKDIYSTAKICDYKNRTRCNLSLEPELTEIITTSNDPEELKHIWVEWRNATGKKVRPLYKKYVELSNLAARLNNFSDNAEFWLWEYEADDIVQQIDNLWEQVKPFYLQIHAYVRGQLRKIYGSNIVPEKGPIPAHLLGNMWSQSWSNIAKNTVPYPGKERSDVTDEMVKQGYDANKIFRLAESCFVSMNMSAMPPLFWENSILVKPNDRELVCHASAWDFLDGKDFRIKQCTRINMEDLLTAHHEMGHIQYYIQYKDQPTVYRDGANPGFHEAIGDLMALSVSTPSHLNKIGLLNADTTDPEADLNHLYAKGLDKIVFLPFAYILDKWRWDVFQGNVTSSNYNQHWWDLREKIQGVSAPVKRTEEDFDIGSKYHIVADVEYLRYFISYLLQFQFHKALCIEAGQYDPLNPDSKPLHVCDITNSTKAGNLLKKMLQMGSSKPWPIALEVLTGNRTMDGNSLLEYFKPLHDWLIKENIKNGEFIGWERQ